MRLQNALLPDDCNLSENDYHSSPKLSMSASSFSDASQVVSKRWKKDAQNG